MEYAVVRTGGKQRRVTPGKRLRVEKLEGDVGVELVFDDVLMVALGDEVQIGQPSVSGAKVRAKIIAQEKDAKIIVFKRARRKGFHKKKGHRQPYTEVEILEIAA